MAALRGNLSELSLFLILVLFLSYVTSEKSYDGTAKDISSILVVSKADVRSYPSCNSGFPRRCKGVSMPLYQTAVKGIYLVKLSMYAGYLLTLLAGDVSLNPGSYRGNRNGQMCPVCSKVIRQNQSRLQCRLCEDFNLNNFTKIFTALAIKLISCALSCMN